MIQVVTPNPGYYPRSYDKLPRMFGDKANRVKWRSKQSLDYSYLYYYCKDMADYFVQLEDDITAEPGYINKMKNYIKLNSDKRWSVLEFGSRGFIGMTYRGEHLASLAKFVRFFYWLMPVDWLFRHYNDMYLYHRSKRFILRPFIFKHVGKYSSLVGQIRKVEGSARKGDQHTSNMPGRRRYQQGGNPSAVMSTTIKNHHGFNRIANPYLTNRVVYWGKHPEINDTITIQFKESQQISRFVAASGNQKNKFDRFYSTELYLSKTKGVDSQCKNFELVGSFDGSLIDHTFKPSPVETVWCLRILLTKVYQRRWLIVEEIAVLKDDITPKTAKHN